MNQCLSCNKPCAATAVFCDNCRATLLNRQQERSKFTQVFPPGAQAKVEQIQINYKPHPSSKEDFPSKNQPKMYRPFQQSTVLASSQDANRLAPAISPELEKAEEDHSESDDSMQQSDPLMTRHLPTSASAAHSDEEELQPVHSAGKKPTTVPLPIFQRYVRSRPLRMAFITLVVAIVLALIVDSVLITFIIHRDNVHVPTSGGVLNNPKHVAVSLTVQPRLHLYPTPGAQSTSPTPPVPGTSTSTALSPGEPILDMATSNLTFTYTQGQGNPGSQEATLANMGGSAFSWQASVSSSASSWLSLDSNAGTVAAAQSVQVSVSVNPSQLSPGKYSAQVQVYAADSSGMQLQNSPQILTVTLFVSAPCSLQVTPSNLAFTVSLLQPDSAGQNITLKEAGNCVRPISWSAQADRGWLILSNSNGTDNGSMTVHANAQEMLPGAYSAQITLSASDSNKISIQVNPQTIQVTLQVNAT